MAFESKYKEDDNWGEIRDCDVKTFPGTKASTRPQQFCKPVTCLDTVDVTGKTTLNETEVIPPEITVGGYAFVPSQLSAVIDGGEIGEDGKLPPLPLTHTFLISG